MQHVSHINGNRYQVKSMPSIRAFVNASHHCNQDSLPLRFGFFYEKDQIIEIEQIGYRRAANHPDRFKIEGWIVNPDTNEKISGVFILTDGKQEGGHALVTAWRHDDSTELYLSEVVRSLRKEGYIDQQWLMAQHRLYVSGALRTHGDLMLLLATKMNEKQVSDFQKIIKALEEKIKRLEQDAIRSGAEMGNAGSQGSVIASSRGTLKAVREQVAHRGSYCTVLEFEDGTQWYMKTATFDRDGAVTQQAKELVGEKVRVTSWDPKNEPGKWSSQGYFRHIYLDRISH